MSSCSMMHCIDKEKKRQTCLEHTISRHFFARLSWQVMLFLRIRYFKTAALQLECYRSCWDEYRHDNLKTIRFIPVLTIILPRIGIFCLEPGQAQCNFCLVIYSS